MKKLYYLILLSLALSSCNSIGKLIFGINRPTMITSENKDDILKKFRIYGDFYEFDTSLNNCIDDINNLLIRKELKQPLHFIYFKNDSSKCHLINCYVGGFPRLKWNRSGTFDSFPPNSRYVKTPDTILIFKDINKFIKSDGDSILSSENMILVTYNLYLEKQSHILIRIAKDYSNKYGVPIYFINNDHLIFKMYNEQSH